MTVISTERHNIRKSHNILERARPRARARVRARPRARARARARAKTMQTHLGVVEASAAVATAR